MNPHKNIILVGNPNSGKTSLFNALTGLNHKVGNFPGVTVDRKVGHFQITAENIVNIIDLPGTYSLYPKGQDEVIAYKTLFNQDDKYPADLVVLVLDATNLRRSLFLATQVLDLKLPTIIALTMMDDIEKSSKEIDLKALEQFVGVPVVTVNPRNNSGINSLKAVMLSGVNDPKIPTKNFYEFDTATASFLASSNKNLLNPYTHFHQLYNEWQMNDAAQTAQLSFHTIQSEEVLNRYATIQAALKEIEHQEQSKAINDTLERTHKIDKVILHPFSGMLILLLVMFTVFQSVFWLANYPMDWIDSSFSDLSAWVAAQLPETWWADLLVNGVIAGLGGVVIFVSQIDILFFMLSILKERGYMARISFLMDRLFQQFGLSGKDTLERTHKIDKVLLHPFWGMLILLLVMFTVFQSVFWLANYPMDWIDSSFSDLSAWVAAQLPETWWADLLVNGVIAGLGGVVIFVPQIAILFFMLSVLEETGYMARISFLMDRLFQQFGLSGKSVVPMISGMACAIPAVMAARTIENRKQRIITILVTPFMSCTARLPVYTILIALIIPETYLIGFIGLQGLVLLGLYLLGFVTALLASSVLNRIMYAKESSYFLQELPIYRSPRWKNALIEMVDKAKVFLLQAGKVILMISIVLWFLSSYGPESQRAPIHDKYEQLATSQGVLNEDQEAAMSSELLETSYAGIIGKIIEPVIAPLGYDWKIGIALLASFAAREVFVGTMATIYAVGDVEDDDTPLRAQMQAARRVDGTPVYTFATGMSLMIFYAFAMQCMATLAVVKREAGGWKMALLQLIMMSGLAYIAALITYQLLK